MRIKPRENNFYLFKKKERKINCIYIFEFLTIEQNFSFFKKTRKRDNFDPSTIQYFISLDCIYIFEDEFLNILRFRKSYEDQTQEKQFLFI